MASKAGSFNLVRYGSFSRPLEDTWLPLPPHSYWEDNEPHRVVMRFTGMYTFCFFLCFREGKAGKTTKTYVGQVRMSLTVPTSSSKLLLLSRRYQIIHSNRWPCLEWMETRELSGLQYTSPFSERVLSCTVIGLLNQLAHRPAVSRVPCTARSTFISVLYCQYYYTYSTRCRNRICAWSRLSNVPCMFTVETRERIRGSTEPQLLQEHSLVPKQDR